MLRLIIILVSTTLLASCATTPGSSATPEERQSVLDIYHCVWYFHLAENEDTSQQLIDAAVTRSEELGFGAAGMLQLYSESRVTQREVISPLAIEMASKREPAVPSIMGPAEDGGSGLEPNDEDIAAAILQTYEEPCLTAYPQ